MRNSLAPFLGILLPLPSPPRDGSWGVLSLGNFLFDPVYACVGVGTLVTITFLNTKIYVRTTDFNSIAQSQETSAIELKSVVQNTIQEDSERR